jgi:hypothetical protein
MWSCCTSGMERTSRARPRACHAGAPLSSHRRTPATDQSMGGESGQCDSPSCQSPVALRSGRLCFRYRLWHAPAFRAGGRHAPHIRCGLPTCGGKEAARHEPRSCRTEPERPVLCSYPRAWFSICADWTLVAWFISTRPKGQLLRSSATWCAYGDASRQRVSSSMSGTCRETRMPSPKGPISYGVHSRTEPSDADVRLLRPEYLVEIELNWSITAPPATAGPHLARVHRGWTSAALSSTSEHRVRTQPGQPTGSH